MEIGICCPVGKAGELKNSGIDYIEAGVQSLLISQQDVEMFASNLNDAKASPLPVRAANGFLPGTLRSTGPERDVEGIVKYATTAFRRAQQVGIEHIVYGSGGSRKLDDGVSPEEGMEQFAEILARLGPIAAAHGVTVVVEPLNRSECNFINSLAEGAEAVHRANHPSIQLLADFYHMLKDGEPAAEVARYGPIIRHCHLAEKATRTCPGIDGDDFRPFFQGLKENGYTGRISIEGKFPNGFEQDAPKAVAEMRRQMNDVGL